MSITVGGGLGVRISGGIVVGPSVGVQLSGSGFSGAFDNTPVIAAYGMRRLRSEHTGNLLRLRRSSDNAESDFGHVANGDLDTAAIATWLGANSGYVVTWYDQSGNGYNATQSTAANQPQYVSQSAGMAFDGTDDYLATTFVPRATGSVFVAFSAAANGGNLFGAISNSSGTEQSFIDSMTTGLRYANGANTLTRDILTAGVAGIAGTKAYRNGSAEAGSFTAATGTNNVALLIGARSVNGAAASSFGQVRINEMIISAATYDATAAASVSAIMAGA